ncbi:MAG: VPDSG-CTERM sorting domain-containing protein [Terriglobia bacterium]
MRRTVSTALLASLALLLFLLPAAQAQNPPAGEVLMYFTGNTSGIVIDGNIYADPYEFDITPHNGSTTSGVWLNCDDTFDEIQGGESWDAYVTSGSNATALQNTQMALYDTKNLSWTYNDVLIAYDEKAWIELQKGVSNADLSNAIWSIFNPSWITNCTGTCATLLNNAATAASDDSANNWATYRSSLTIYSYDGGGVSGGTAPPQEFDAVPDGGLTVMLLGGALIGLAALRRRFRV